jgi:hypothetical protein
MVLFRGPNVLGPANRDEKGGYEQMESRIKKYMKMGDEEWDSLYNKMYNDRKYPGQNSIKTMIIPGVFYTFFASTFGYELYLKRSNLGGSTLNFVKLALIPIFGVLTLRNVDVAVDILKYRQKYPEMYQP